MRFQLIQKEWDSCDGYDTYWSDFNPAGIDGAHPESYWTPDIWSSSGYTIKQKAVIDDNGKPYIKTWKEDFKPDKKWFKEGRNHKQLEQCKWEREVEARRVFIDFDTLDELVEFIEVHNAGLESGRLISGYFKVAEKHG